MATDPVCGMQVDNATELTSTREGRKYYFCSASCKLQFEKPERELKALRLAIAVSWPLTLAVVALTYAVHQRYAGLAALVLSGIVQFYSGRRFYAGTLDALRNRSANMETLIATGTTAAWAYSAAITLLPGAAAAAGAYFDTSAIIVSLVLTGTYMQRLAESRAAGAVSALIALRPKMAHLFRGDAVTDVPIERVRVGDILLVRPGEAVPTDSVVVHGAAEVDESAITGESVPVRKGLGAPVIGGTICAGGSLRVRATKIGDDTAIAQIIKVVQDAASSKVPVQQLADRISSYFVPVVVLVGAVSSVSWYAFGGVSPRIAVLIFVSVLVIACPCALGIATPAALLVASGAAAKRGILVKSGNALQAASRVDTVVLDKTGTLTKGRPAVTDIVPANGRTAAEVLRAAATAEANSEHPLGRAIVERARRAGLKVAFPRRFAYKQGSGVVAVGRNGTRIAVGSRRLVRSPLGKLERKMPALEAGGKTVLIVGIGNRAAGLLALADELKPDSKAAVAALRGSGVEVWLVTGDNERAAASVARELGIRNVVPEAEPGDKMDRIAELQRSGRVVAMVGDGVNDAPALTKADLGIAIGAGTEVALQAGGIVLVKSSVYDAFVALELGRRTMKKIRQNLFWAFAYNVTLIPVAAGALIPSFTVSVYGFLPFFSALAMAFSSLAVVANSLLLSRFRA